MLFLVEVLGNRIEVGYAVCLRDCNADNLTMLYVCVIVS